MDDDVNRLRIALGKISRSIDRGVSDDGMTRTRLSLLGSVARSGSLGIGELAEIEGLNPTMASRIVGKLEDDGLVRRTQGAADRRAVTVEITAEGTKRWNRLRRRRTDLLTGWLADLPADERTALLHAVPALESLAASMRAGSSV